MPSMTYESEQEKAFYDAYAKTVAETKEMRYGDIRVEAVRRICVKQIESYYSYSSKVHFSKSTLQKWVNEFVYQVGKKYGF